MRRLSSEKVIYHFTPENTPAYWVKSGEKVIVETRDCFSGKAKGPKDLFEDIAMGAVNPATGPIALEGLVAGETLCVSIDRIKCGKTGVIMCSPELGILGREVRRARTKVVPIKGSKALFSDDIAIELNPHVGVIGVSPREGKVPVYYPGDFGGNMDTVEVREGSRVHLPTFVDEGMVSIGDVHAAMGDGEVCGTAIEVPAEVQARFSKTEDLELKRPMVETSTEWISYAAAATLDHAAKLATSDMVRFIRGKLGMGFEDAYMLASVAANLKISQVVDPLVAARMSISKKYL